MSTRRKFLFDCSTAMAALAVTPLTSIPASATPGGNFQSLDRMSYAALAGQINTSFRVRVTPHRFVELTLLKAPLGPPTPQRPGRRLPWDAANEKFSLIFSGPKDAPLASAIQRFEHPRLGSFEMSIGQIGADHPERIRYEAVFNRPARAPFTHTSQI
jgi:hypothetical protein